AGNGVSTYLALIFGTLLSSQGTDASFVLTQVVLGLSSGQFPFGLAFPTLSDRFPIRFPVGGICLSAVFDLLVSLAAFRHSLR
ncbi:hypothetical protein ACFU53_43865, partial [Streptomyces sp. NPDC057474]|uniref:hypothetical protein n=1 Tax=Streptomyces sp. NPDC057474 TaxID=3346144 RepID=UPI0036944030